MFLSPLHLLPMCVLCTAYAFIFHFSFSFIIFLISSWRCAFHIEWLARACVNAHTVLYNEWLEVLSLSFDGFFTDFYCLLAHSMFDVMESAWCCNRRRMNVQHTWIFCAVQAMDIRLWMPCTTYTHQIFVFLCPQSFQYLIYSLEIVGSRCSYIARQCLPVNSIHVFHRLFYHDVHCLFSPPPFFSSLSIYRAILLRTMTQPSKTRIQSSVLSTMCPPNWIVS